MKFETKLFFNGIEKRHSNKTGKDYFVIKLYDYDANTGFDLFVQDIDKYKDYKSMTAYNFNLQVTKQGDLISLNIV